ncbi:MAG: winged helix DNA-binding protein [Myxococcales bacterium]|nr:winged helix DNA-binding protein [Myxococcales bacterium]
MMDDDLKRFRREHLGRLLHGLHGDFAARTMKRHPTVKLAHLQVFATLPLEGARLTTLAERAGITKQSMGALVSELEGLGILERGPDPDDGRATRIRFSKKGLRLLGRAKTAADEVEALYAEKLGAKRYARMKKDLADLVRALDIEIPA